MDHSTYIAIDLKSFYASVECKDRQLNALTANLVVADISRTNKTICLAVSPSLKSLGISGRPRLFEVEQKIAELNRERLKQIKRNEFSKEEWDITRLKKYPDRKITYIIARPRMAKYLAYSKKIYQIYLRFFAAEDIHVYSIDEVMIDATSYLKSYRMSAKELAGKVIRSVLEETGITATAGIGTNLYLCKVAMDIIAKRIPTDENGVQIGELDELSYRKLLWKHRPLTDFWRIGRGYARKLEKYGMYTMEDIAKCSLGKEGDIWNEGLLYRLFGVNAELLIDHAWGYESCTMHAIKTYHPRSQSISSGQVLQFGYDYRKIKIVVMEMVEQLCLELVEKRLYTNQIGIVIGYDIESLKDSCLHETYTDVVSDWYGRPVPKPASGTIMLSHHTMYSKEIMQSAKRLFERLVDKRLLVRRLNISFHDTIKEEQLKNKMEVKQLDLFSVAESVSSDICLAEQEDLNLQQAILSIKKKYGKNKLVKVRDLEEGATAIERNCQIGGHKA